MNGSARRLLWDGVLVAVGTVLLTSAALYVTFHFVRGYQFFQITTTSMTGALDRGTVVAVHDVPPHTIRAKTDIIAFHCIPDGKVVIHRMVGVTWNLPDVHQVIHDQQGNVIGRRWTYAARQFETKGDANAVPDPRLVNQDQVIGKVAFVVPFPLDLPLRLAGRSALVAIGIGALFLYVALTGWQLFEARRRRGSPGAAVDSFAGAAAAPPVSAREDDA